MADARKRRPENDPGNFFVDSTCIDCGMCYWMAPGTFEEVGDMSAVVQQPKTPEAILLASRALVSCPTSSIGTLQTPPQVKEAIQDFPLAIAENVYHCGYHSKASYGAASYFIQRPEGNVLIDSPRFATPLVKRLEAMGGIRYLYLTHKDDVADHELFHRHFGCERILHEADADRGLAGLERYVAGEGPVTLDPDLTLIPVSGHTKGHTVLLYRERFLFTGDHLAWSNALGHLTAFRHACWYSWPTQIESMKRLKGYAFEWVLPGHGWRHQASSDEMAKSLEACITWMQAQ